MPLSLGSIHAATARALALFLGCFTLLNIAGTWFAPGFDANGWWIDVGFMPFKTGHAILIYGALALVATGIHWPKLPWVQVWEKTAIGALISVTTWNTFTFYWFWFWGSYKPGVKVPVSMILGLVLGFVARAIWRPEPMRGWPCRVVFATTFIAAMVAFPIAQMYCFGRTDYRRDADAIVVFGAKANADGTPSQALDDRVRTAIALYKEKRAPLLIFSGGPGAGTLSEPQVMRNVALAEGVPDSAIILDEKGLNTEATVADTVPLFTQRHIKKVLAVSHDYHLPRVKMTYERALANTGIAVYTVPAIESQPLTAKPYFMAREVAALWVYYLRPLWGG